MFRFLGLTVGVVQSYHKVRRGYYGGYKIAKKEIGKGKRRLLVNLLYMNIARANYFIACPMLVTITVGGSKKGCL